MPRKISATNGIINLSGYPVNVQSTSPLVRVFNPAQSILGVSTTNIIYSLKPYQENSIGLLGEYYYGLSFNQLVKIKTDTKISNDWVELVPVEELDGFYGNYGTKIIGFTSIWSGYFVPSTPAQTQLRVSGQGGIKLTVNGTNYQSQWSEIPGVGGQPEGTNVVEVTIDSFEGMKVPLRIEFLDSDNPWSLGNASRASILLQYRMGTSGPWLNVPDSFLQSLDYQTLPAISLRANSVKNFGTIGGIVNVPPNLLLNGPVIVRPDEGNYNIKFSKSGSLVGATDIATIYSLDDLTNTYVLAWLPMQEGYSYNIIEFTNKGVISNRVSGLTPQNYTFENLSNMGLTGLNTIPENGYLERFDFPQSELLTNINFTTNSLGELTGLTLSNTYSEPLDTGVIKISNRAINYRPDGLPTRENIFSYYQYPPALDKRYVQITNWSVGLFGYGQNGVETTQPDVELTRVVTSINEEPTIRNGELELNLTSTTNIIYKTCMSNETAADQAAYQQNWNGRHEGLNMLMPDMTAYSRVFVRDEAYNTVSVVSPLEIDTTRPGTEITSPTNNEQSGDWLTVTGTVSDKNWLGYNLTLTNQNGTESGYNADGVSVVPVAAGTLGTFDTLGLTNATDVYLSVCDQVSNTNRVVVHLNLTNSDSLFYRVLTAGPKYVKAPGQFQVTYRYDTGAVSPLNIRFYKSMSEYSENNYTTGSGIVTFTDTRQVSDYTVDGVYTYSNTIIPGAKPQITRMLSYTYDSTLPEASLAALTNNQVLTGKVAFAGTASDANFAGYRLMVIMPGATTNTISSANTPVTNNRLGEWLTEGLEQNPLTAGNSVYTVVLESYDLAGNTNTTSRGVRVDNAKPVVELSLTEGQYLSGLNGDPLIKLKVIDGNLAHVWLGYNETQMIANVYPTTNTLSLSAPWNCGLLPSGSYAVQLQAEDHAGSTASVTRTVILDNTKPVITLTNAPFVLNRLVLNGGVSDNNKLVSVSVDVLSSDLTMTNRCAAYTMRTNSFSFDLDQTFDSSDLSADSTIAVTAVDIAGNTNVWQQSVTIDQSPPSVEI
ncbi:MAG: Ig-like domain repeat protein, partial [Sedimentisphaerales bacterium]|nr:Ig-like domain repeat protein [Sedimentisphaerales bacterium]